MSAAPLPRPSALTRQRPARRSPAQAQVEERPSLYVVRGYAPARSALPFLVAVLLILAGALVASMLLNAAMADTAYKMQRTQVELNVVNDHIDTVRTQLHDVSASDHLAQRAAELGMVPAEAPGVVDLTTEQASGGRAAIAQAQK